MTTKVIVNVPQTHNNKKVKVTVLDLNYETKEWAENQYQTVVLESGASIEVTVYDSRKVEISEI